MTEVREMLLKADAAGRSESWLAIKESLRSNLIKASIRLSRKRDARIRTAFKVYDETYKSDHRQVIKEVLLDGAQRRINALLAMRNEGAQVRSRVRFRIPDERPTGAFFAWEKLGQQRKTMAVLKDCRDVNDSIDKATDFYTHLYSTKDTLEGPERRLLSMITAAEPDAIALMNSPITEQEVVRVIRNSPRHSAPGIDGLSFELYRECLPYIAPILASTFNRMASDGTASHQLLESKTILLFKKGDKTKIENYRPLSIQNVDMRLLGAIIAERLQNGLCKWFSENQCGFIRNRSTHDAILLAQHVIRKCTREGMGGHIALVDWEKAYDRVSHAHMLRVLGKATGDGLLLYIVKALYSNATTRIYLNGLQSSPVKINSGVRQGCPASPLLFNVVLESLARIIAALSDFTGIQSIRQVYFADDSTFFLRDKYDELAMETALRLYELGTGAKRNTSKTVLLRIGKQDETTTLANNNGYCVTDGPTLLLGFPIGNTVSSDDIWKEPIAKMRTASAIWSQKQLTLRGKTTICNLKLLNRINYRAAIARIPDSYRREIAAIVRSFLFGRRAWCSEAPWTMRREDGGLGVIDTADLNDAMLAKLAGKIADGTHSLWSRLAIEEMWPYGRTFMDQTDTLAPIQPAVGRVASARRRKRPPDTSTAYWTEVRGAYSKIARFTYSVTSNVPACLDHRANRNSALWMADLPVTAFLHPDGAWRLVSDLEHTRKKRGYSPADWRALRNEVDREYRRRPRFNTEGELYHRLAPASPCEPFTIPARKLMIEQEAKAYTTKVGRTRLAKKREPHSMHTQWIGTQHEDRILKTTTRSDNCPVDVVDLRWRIRHLCLFHLHAAMTCEQCGAEIQPGSDTVHWSSSCPFAEIIWKTIAENLGISNTEMSEETRIWGPLPRQTTAWQNRLAIGLTLVHLHRSRFRKPGTQPPTARHVLDAIAHDMSTRGG